MQTTTLPIQGAQTGAAPQRAATGIANTDNGEFRAALAREIGQRQEAPAPAPKPAAAQPKPQPAQDAPAEPETPAPQAAQGEAKPEPKAANSAPADRAKEDRDSPAEHPAAAQVTDMLALVASLKQQASPADAAPAARDGAVAVANARGDGATDLAALQGAFRTLTKGSGQAPSSQGATAPDQLRNPAAAAPGADGAAIQPPDLRAGRDAFAAQLKLQPEAAPVREALAEVAAPKEPAPAAPLMAPATAAVFEAAQAVAAAPREHIAARVGSAAWDQQVGQKIVWMVAGEEQSASLTLNPPDLGPLQVVLSVTNDQASIAFSSSQQEVRQALENALPRLREMMGENGIALGNATVDAGTPDGRQAQGGEQPRGRGAESRIDNGTAVAEHAPRTGARVTTLGERGMVDTFA
jgi:flagellar hook-length control protein FliK